MNKYVESQSESYLESRLPILIKDTDHPYVLAYIRNEIRRAWESGYARGYSDAQPRDVIDM